MRNTWVGIAGRTIAATALAVSGLCPPAARAQNDEETRRDNGAHCSSTAAATFESCKDGAEADYKLAIGKCINIADKQARSLCVAEARDARDEARRLCQAQRQARREVCAALGEGRYAPDLDPSRFDSAFG